VTSFFFIFFYFFLRIISAYDSKILGDRVTSNLYVSLSKRYNDTSFSSFANLILDTAREKKCNGVYTSCQLDVHVR
jgi:hypothetical protein